MRPGSVRLVDIAETELFYRGLVRRGSTREFSSVLPDREVDLFSAFESHQDNLIREALARTGGRLRIISATFRKSGAR